MKSKKTKITMSILVGCISMLISCTKTYTCKDKMGNTTGQYKSYSKEKAKNACASCEGCYVE